MRQKLCRRLEDLEKISAAAAARRVNNIADYEQKMAAIMEEVHAWHADPLNQKWLAEQPPDYLRSQMRALEHELADRANGHRRAAA